MQEKLKCKNCGFEGDFTSIKTDRFCSQCGNPLFMPLDKIEQDTDWNEIYNSYYNLQTLIPENVQYSINRFCNWRYGITAIGKMLRNLSEEDSEKLDKSIVFHRSFFRSGYAIRITEEKIFNKDIDIKNINLNLLKEEGEKIFKDQNVNVFDQVWDINTHEENNKNKNYFQKILPIAYSIKIKHSEFFLIDEIEQYIVSIINDCDQWSKKENIVGINSEDILFDVLYGYSCCIAERLIKERNN